MGYNAASRTIRGITYNVKSTFKCYEAHAGRGDSEGGGGTSITLTKGATYTYLAYGTDSSGALTAYPYCVGDASGNGIGWFKEHVFPYKTYTVTYNANGGSGAPSAQTKKHGVTLTLSSTKPTRTGYTFQGWGTTATDTSVNYAAGANYTSNAAITLYAIWKAHTYTVAYNANGGTGTMASETFTYGVQKAITPCTFTKTGYSFNGWQAYRHSDQKWAYGEGGGTTNSGWYKEGSQPSGYSKIRYNNTLKWTKGSAVNKDTITLYAQWKMNCYVYIDNGTSFDEYLVYIDNGTSWDLYAPYIDNGSSWESYG